jgi:hypothetical protein
MFTARLGLLIDAADETWMDGIRIESCETRGSDHRPLPVLTLNFGDGEVVPVPNDELQIDDLGGGFVPYINAAGGVRFTFYMTVPVTQQHVEQVAAVNDAAIERRKQQRA